MANLQKYQSRNPAQRWLIQRFLRLVVGLARRAPPGPVLDAGCGEGFVSAALRRHLPAAPPILAVDVSRPALGHLRRLGVAALPLRGDLRALPFGDRRFSLVVATEVLEHLEEPAPALDELCRVAAGPVLLSVPREPFFSGLNLLRGRNLRRLGADEDHHQLWTRGRFLRFLAPRLRVLAAPRDAFPWTLVLAEVRR